MRFDRCLLVWYLPGQLKYLALSWLSCSLQQRLVWIKPSGLGCSKSEAAVRGPGEMWARQERWALVDKSTDTLFKGEQSRGGM